MAQTSGSKLTPAELAALEHAFAADPTSEAYRPLAEAYLAMGRYMEAMVVCKKGVKAHPSSPDARVLLARVYADQGKDRKALDEVKGALDVAPDDPGVLLYSAELHFKTGETATGADHLQRAAKARPEDEAVLALARKHNVVVAAPPPPPPPPAPPPPAAAVAQGPQGFAAPPAVNGGYATPPPGYVPAGSPPPMAAAPGGPPTLGPAMAPPAMQQGYANPAAYAAQQPAAAHPHAHAMPHPGVAPAAPPVRRKAPRPQFDPNIDLSRIEEAEAAVRSRSSKKGLVSFAVTALVLVVALGGIYSYTRWKAARDRQISKLLDDTGALINKDTYASYKEATGVADQILELDSDNYVAHAYLSYIAALRWGEQGEGDEFKRRASEHLKNAQQAKEPHGRIYAADAYITFFNGDPKAAEESINKVIETGQKSGLLTTTLGIIQMYAGDLDKAAATLKQAQGLEPNSVRVLSALGQLNRRRGMDAEAWTFFDSALRLDKEHADSLLGKALLVLDANDNARPRDEQEALYKEAEEQISKVMNLPSGAISARQLALAKFAQAQLLFARNKTTEATKLENEARTLDPNNPDIRLMAGRRLLREGKGDDAVAEIREAIKIDDKRASFYVDLSRALMMKQGGAKEAVDALRTALKTFPQSGKINVLLGDAHRAAGDVDEARRAYEKAIEVEKGRMPEARAKIGQIFREKKEYAKAKDELEKAVKEFGLSAGGEAAGLALTELGRVLLEGQTPDPVAAFEQFSRARAAAPSYAPPAYFLGKLSATQKDKELQAQGKELLEEYLKLAPRGEFADEARTLAARLR